MGFQVNDMKFDLISISNSGVVFVIIDRRMEKMEVSNSWNGIRFYQLHNWES